MSSDSNIWFRVGYALEQARGQNAPDDAPHPRKSKGGAAARDADPGWPTGDALVATGVVALAGKLLDVWRPARKVTFTRLLRAGAAGAAAALVLDLMKSLLEGRAELPTLDRDAGPRLLAGAGQGLLYGALVEPRVPGPPVVKGAVFALAEYMADPAGGLTHVLGAHTPQGRLPILSDLLHDLEPRDREILEHLVFGITLAILCGSSPTANGLREVEFED